MPKNKSKRRGSKQSKKRAGRGKVPLLRGTSVPDLEKFDSQHQEIQEDNHRAEELEMYFTTHAESKGIGWFRANAKQQRIGDGNYDDFGASTTSINGTGPPPVPSLATKPKFGGSTTSINGSGPPPIPPASTKPSITPGGVAPVVMTGAAASLAGKGKPPPIPDQSLKPKGSSVTGATFTPPQSMLDDAERIKQNLERKYGRSSATAAHFQPNNNAQENTSAQNQNYQYNQQTTEQQPEQSYGYDQNQYTQEQYQSSTGYDQNQYATSQNQYSSPQNQFTSPTGTGPPPIPSQANKPKIKPRVTPAASNDNQPAQQQAPRQNSATSATQGRTRLDIEKDLSKKDVDEALKEYQKRVKELHQYYRKVDPDRPSKQKHCQMLLRKYPPGNVAIAVMKKYGEIPEGWEHLYEEAQQAIMHNTAVRPS